jgi:hypothetical protein
MAKQATVLQDGVDQIRQAVRRADRELKKIQKQVEARRRRLAKEVTTRRRTIEKRAQRELDRLQKQIQSQPLVKRAEALRADAQERLGRGVSTFLDALPIATRSDVERIDRKVSALGRRLKEIEKAQNGGNAEAA